MREEFAGRKEGRIEGRAKKPKFPNIRKEGRKEGRCLI